MLHKFQLNVARTYWHIQHYDKYIYALFDKYSRLISCLSAIDVIPQNAFRNPTVNERANQSNML